MNPETQQDMIPRTEAPRTDAPRTDIPVPDTAPPKKEKGLLGKYFDVWTDRDLDTEHCDTSEWNIFYYYYRHICQKRTALKLKYLKWLALLFQLYFFGSIALVLVRVLFFSKHPFDPIKDLAGFLSISSMQFLIPLVLLAPPIMVCASFKLRTKNRGFMTSRAKEPPLLAHLVRYTTNKGLIRGALQSLLFTWRKFVLLMLPCIVTAVALLICYAVFVAKSPWAVAAAFCSILSVVLFLATLSMFFVMQFFCFRMDSLMVMIGVGALALAQFVGSSTQLLGFGSKTFDHFLGIAMTAALIPSYAFALVYFPLAAADTNEFGLGKRYSKQIRVLLYSVIGFFFAMLLAEDILLFLDDFKLLMTRGNVFALYTFLHAFFSWGLAICISCLLVTSVSFTSQQAALLRRSRTEQPPFLRKLFDPASAWSLLPVVALEILFLAIGNWTFRHLYLGDNAKLFYDDPAALRRVSSIAVHTVSMYAMQVWTVMHIALIPSRKLIMDPWESHVPFNRICMFFFIFIPLIIALNRILAARFFSAGIIFYLGSIFAFVMAKRCAPSETVLPAAKQEDSAL